MVREITARTGAGRQDISGALSCSFQKWIFVCGQKVDRFKSLGLTLGTGAEVLAVEPVKPGAGNVPFLGGFFPGQFPVSMAGEEMADDGSGKAFDQF